MDRTAIAIEIHEDGAHVFVYKGRRGVGRAHRSAAGVPLGEVPSVLEALDKEAKERLDAKDPRVAGGA